MEVCNGVVTFVSEKKSRVRVDFDLGYAGKDGEYKYATKVAITLHNGENLVIFSLAEAEEIIHLAQQAVDKAYEFLNKYPWKESER